MKRVILKLAVALFTFLVGVVITWLLTFYPSRPTERTLVFTPPVTGLRVKPKHPEGWKKIDVENAFSFYVPPDMKELDVLGCPFGVRQHLGNQSLWVGYDYVPKGMMEYGYRGKLSCEVFEGALTASTIERISEMEVGGRRARVIFRQPDKLIHGRMSLCLQPEGALLSFRVGSRDAREMDIAKQVVDSIEFR
jgi:hypothetical protein